MKKLNFQKIEKTRVNLYLPKALKENLERITAEVDVKISVVIEKFLDFGIKTWDEQNGI